MKNSLDWLTWSADEERWLPQVRDNNSLRFDPDLSTTWREHLQDAHNVGPEAALDGRVDDLVFQMTSSKAIEMELTTEHTPDKAKPAPLGCAHASVWRDDGLDRGQRKVLDFQLSAAMVLVHGTPPPPQPGS